MPSMVYKTQGHVLPLCDAIWVTTYNWRGFTLKTHYACLLSANCSNRWYFFYEHRKLPL